MFSNSLPALLLVDDQAMLRAACARALCRKFRVTTAPGALAALALIERQHFEVLVTDCQMPAHDGVWLLEQVRLAHPRLVRVLISGIRPVGLQSYLRSGLLQLFIAKPELPVELHRIEALVVARARRASSRMR